ncbi:MAG: DUF2384 domain-containing protein [Gammaproteobacteria bacterium]|nr:MAG: DUF2384 domain-containing protein [Gammaproteobacteria bacterium]
MPLTHPFLKTTRSIKEFSSSTDRVLPPLEPQKAGQAVIKGLEYLKKRLAWSGTKIANILHLPPNTVNTWLKNGIVPIKGPALHPDVQAIIHLLAIHRSLEAMFENPAHQRAWLSTLHPELNVIPEKLMGKSIEGLIFIRQYLDYSRGRGA